MKAISSNFSKFLSGTGCLLPIIGVIIFSSRLMNNSGGSGFFIATILFIIALFLFGYSKTLEDRRKEHQHKALQAYSMKQVNVQKMQSIISHDLLIKVALDYGEKQFYVWSAREENGKIKKKPQFGMTYQLEKYPFSIIEAIAMLEDGYMVSSSNKNTGISSNILETFIKNEVVEKEGSEPSKKPIDQVKLIELIIQLNDKINPFYRIRFYHDPHLAIRKKSPEYTAYFREMQLWFNKFAALPKLVTSPIQEEIAERDAREHPFPQTNATVSFVNESHVKMKVDEQTYSLDLNRPDEFSRKGTVLKNNTSSLEEVPNQEATLSYFEKLVAQNKKQLTDSPSQKK